MFISKRRLLLKIANLEKRIADLEVQVQSQQKAINSTHYLFSRDSHFINTDLQSKQP